MEILTIKDKNYNVASMRDIFEILDSNGMNEVSRYIRRYIRQIGENSIIAMEDSSKLSILFNDIKDNSNAKDLNGEIFDILKEFIISIDEALR